MKFKISDFKFQIGLLASICILQSAICNSSAQTKIREGSQTQGALPTAQGGAPAGGSTNQVLTKINGTDYNYSWQDPTGAHTVTFIVQSNGVLTSGTQNAHKLLQDESGTLQGCVMMAKPSGSVTIDLLRAADGAGLPTVSIIGSGTMLSLSSAVEGSFTSFSGWTSTTLNAKDNLAISLSGISSITYLQVRCYFK